VERSVLDCVGRGSVTVDEIVETSDLAASQVLSTLSVLEMRRLVRRLPGNRIERL
jgi:DNA processing protein